MDLLTTLDRFFDQRRPLAAGDRIVVAFSGGADSTALLWGLTRLAARRRFAVAAAHLDHELDPGSAERARRAARLAGELAVPLIAARRPVALCRRSGESVEAAARRVRYAFLEQTRRAAGARYVATGHHRDDQAETVLLRMLYGTGVEGLAGIRPESPAGGPTLVRPLLTLPRSALARALAARGLAAVDDPTNRRLDRPRNLLRHRLMPALSADHPDLTPRTARLAAAARSAAAAIEARLVAHLGPTAVEGGVAVPRAALAALPAPLLPFALALLHRRAGARYPAGAAARVELVRQLATGGRAGCDCGDGWRWRVRGELLVLARRRPPTPRFTYTLDVPGDLDIPELALRFRLFEGDVEPWMFRGSPHRAGLALPIVPGGKVIVRSRREGDRIRPLGAPGSRRLKQVLIDRRLPRRLRDRLPLLCLGDDGATIAWVPGVTVAEDFRLRRGGGPAWVAEVESR